MWHGRLRLSPLQVVWAVTISTNGFAAEAPKEPPPVGAAGPPMAIDARFGKIDQRAIYGPPGVYFPEQAVHTGVSGVAILDCRAGAENLLDACSLVSEKPAGYDFGDAALKMAVDHAITAGVAADGSKPTPGQRVLVRAPFELPR